MSQTLWIRILDQLSRGCRDRWMLQRGDRTVRIRGGLILAVTMLLGAGFWCNAPTVDDQTAEGETPIGEVSAMIGPEGGTLSITEGMANGTQLVIPPGALRAMTRISARPIIDSTSVLPNNVSAAGLKVDFQPDGQHFDIPVKLTLPITETSMDKNSEMAIYTRGANDKVWTKVPGPVSVDPDKRIIVGEITHFCEYTPALGKLLAVGLGLKPGDKPNNNEPNNLNKLNDPDNSKLGELRCPREPMCQLFFPTGYLCTCPPEGKK